MLTNSACRARLTRGLSLVEAMVGITVGLLVLAGALTLFVGNVSSSRRMTTEIRVNQDLRAAVDVVARDLRRAGYWGHAIRGTLATGATATTAQNPYSTVGFGSSSNVSYRFSRDASENDALDANESFGFRLQSGVLQMQIDSATWQDLTDARTVTVTAFSLVPTQTALALGNLCPKVCSAGTTNCPVSTVRQVAITLSGRGVSDSTLSRSLSTVVRIRGDQLSGQCPA